MKCKGVLLVYTCERCKREIYRYDVCNYCGRKICNSCIKSSQTSTKTVHLVICKDCWTNIEKRKMYKHKQVPVQITAKA